MNRYDAVGAIQMAFRRRANNGSLLYANWARRALLIWYFGMADAGDDLLVIIDRVSCKCIKYNPNLIKQSIYIQEFGNATP